MFSGILILLNCRELQFNLWYFKPVSVMQTIAERKYKIRLENKLLDDYDMFIFINLKLI
jgi:hypothetical protein